VKFSKRKLALLGAGLVLAGVLVYLFLPAPAEVDVAAVTPGALLVTVDHEGKTRVRERYVVSAPLAGRLKRIELHAGDAVKEGETILALIEPGDPSLLDARARAEAEAKESAAKEACNLTTANLTQARSELERAKKLVTTHVLSQEEYDRAEHKERAARFAVKVAEFELEQARAALRYLRPRSPGEADTGLLTIRSPITGCVLEVLQESSRVVAAGTDLLRIGDTGDLECVIDVLSTDAVKVRPGAKAFLEHWGGPVPLLGRVRLVEPGGFLKVSALGVEEQRVNVLIDFVEPREKWQALGDAYRVEARIVVWEGTDVLKVPSGALFHRGDDWAVFRIVSGKARLTTLRVGHGNGVQTEVLEGLDEKDQVIVHPADRVQDGTAVAPRRTGAG
jgi:HlyD family secretion protein